MKPAATEPRALQRIVIMAKVGASDGPKLAAEVGEWLERRGVSVFFEADTASSLGHGQGVPRERFPEGIDLAVVAGGDGTLLAAARAAKPQGIPILGVHLGSLGFLTELTPEELLPGLESVLEGRYTVEERHTLRARHVRAGRVQSEYSLLNDAVITKSALARMVELELQVDGDEVARYRSDGLIIATPTGSTAYNLSAGGPILDPRMSAFVISPICPHSMTFRPLVVPGSVTVEVALRSSDEEVYLTLDGQIGFPLDADDVLAIDHHPDPVRLIRVAGRGFFEVLRRKLRWGS
jgi:NAD+ kinase